MRYGKTSIDCLVCLLCPAAVATVPGILPVALTTGAQGQSLSAGMFTCRAGWPSCWACADAATGGSRAEMRATPGWARGLSRPCRRSAAAAAAASPSPSAIPRPPSASASCLRSRSLLSRLFPEPRKRSCNRRSELSFGDPAGSMPSAGRGRHQQACRCDIVAMASGNVGAATRRGS